MTLEDLFELSFEEPWPNLVDNNEIIAPQLAPRVARLIASAKQHKATLSGDVSDHASERALSSSQTATASSFAI